MKKIKFATYNNCPVCGKKLSDKTLSTIDGHIVCESESVCSCGFYEFYAYGAYEASFRKRKHTILTSYTNDFKYRSRDKFLLFWWRILYLLRRRKNNENRD